MAYATVRLYSGPGDSEEILRIVTQELAPQIIAAGCQRYGLVRFDNSYGSVSFYQEQQDAEHCAEIAARWVKETGLMREQQLIASYSGEVFFAYDGKNSSGLDGASGMIRVYQTEAAIADITAAFNQEVKPQLEQTPGLLRYVACKIDTGFVVMAAHQTPEDADMLRVWAAQKRVDAHSLISKVAPNGPTSIQGTIVQSFTG